MTVLVILMIVYFSGVIYKWFETYGYWIDWDYSESVRLIEEYQPTNVMPSDIMCNEITETALEFANKCCWLSWGWSNK